MDLALLYFLRLWLFSLYGDVRFISIFPCSPTTWSATSSSSLSFNCSFVCVNRLLLLFPLALLFATASFKFFLLNRYISLVFLPSLAWLPLLSIFILGNPSVAIYPPCFGWCPHLSYSLELIYLIEGMFASSLDAQIYSCVPVAYFWLMFHTRFSSFVVLLCLPWSVLPFCLYTLHLGLS